MTLKIRKVKTSHGGNYKCRADSEAGTDEREARLVVNSKSKGFFSFSLLRGGGVVRVEFVRRNDRVCIQYLLHNISS